MLRTRKSVRMHEGWQKQEGRAGGASVEPVAAGKGRLRAALPHRVRCLACTKTVCSGYQSHSRSFLFCSALDRVKIIKEHYFWRLREKNSLCAPVPAVGTSQQLWGQEQCQDANLTLSIPGVGRGGRRALITSRDRWCTRS